MSNLFTQQNTDGYSDDELKNLNEEWEAKIYTDNLIAGSDLYNQRAKEFQHMIARR